MSFFAGIIFFGLLLMPFFEAVSTQLFRLEMGKWVIDGGCFMTTVMEGKRQVALMRNSSS